MLALGLSACGGDSNGGTSPDQGGEPIEIAYIHRLPDGDGMTKVADLAAQWNQENPDIQVTTTKFDGRAAEMIVKLENDVQAGAAPCLAQLGYSEVPSMYSKGLLLDVTDEATKYESNYASGPYAMMTVGGVTVGLPQDTGPLVYYYNAAEFERLGIEAPTTTAELREAAVKAKEDGKYVLVFQPDEAQHWLSGQAAAAGAVWYTAENDEWQVNVTSPETAKVADFWQDLIDNDLALVENRWEDGFAQALIDQKVIGTIGAAWEAPLLADTMAGSANEGQWTVVNLPQYDGGGSVMTGPDGGSGVAVLKGCEYPAEAMAFNDWLNTQIDPLLSQGLVVAAEGDVTTPEAISTFYGGADVASLMAEANAALSKDFVYMPTWPAVGEAMATAAAAAGDGSGKVADVFEAAQTESVKSLEDAGLPVAK